MLKVLIADMDLDNITNFKSFIKKNFSNYFKLEKSALTVKELNENINTRKPDIIIIDMRFFGSAGLQSIKDLNFKYPNIKFILYGNYSDTEYMKMCMDYGTIAYMYRPVKSIELERCLKDALEFFENARKIEVERKLLIAKYNEQILLFETKFLSTLVKGHLSDEYEILSSFKYFNLLIENPYTVALLRVDHFKKIVLSIEEKEKHLIIFKVLNIINKKLYEINNGKAFINNFNEICIILGKINDFEEILNILSEIKETVQRDIKFEISIGIGRIYSSAVDIHTSFNQSVAALRYRCIIGYNSIIPIDYVEPDNNITYSYPLDREELLVYTAVIGEYNYCIKILREILDALKASGKLHEKLLQQIIMDILISINRNAFEQNINITGVNKFFATENIFKVTDIDKAFEYMSKGLRAFCTYMLEIRKDKEIKLYQNTLAYVNENYFESLNVIKMAAKFNCAPEYFKKVFKDNSKKTFSEYLSNLRIKHAKKIILETDFDDNSVAINVGYNDIAVFRAVFKQVEGYAVDDFRYLNNRNIKRGLNI